MLPIFLFAAASAFAQPKIQVVGGNSFDWGDVTPGVHEYDLTVVNAGTDTLELLGLASGMASVVGEIEKTSLAHGDSVKLKVKMETTRYTGERKGWVKIQSNDPVHGFIEVSLRAFAVRYLYAEPDGAVLFDDVVVGKESKQEVTFTNISHRDVTLSPKVEVSGGQGVMRVEIPRPVVIPAGRSIKLNAYLTPLEAGKGECFIEFSLMEKELTVPKVQVLFMAKPAAGAQ